MLTGNRNGLIVNTALFPANGLAERAAATTMLQQIAGFHRVTVGVEKGYDTRDFAKECRHLRVTPHVAQNMLRPGGIGGSRKCVGSLLSLPSPTISSGCAICWLSRR
jgi:hypothetical protein